MRNNRYGNKIRDILQPMGLFPIIPKRAWLNIPRLRSFIPRLEITPAQITELAGQDVIKQLWFKMVAVLQGVMNQMKNSTKKILVIGIIVLFIASTGAGALAGIL